MDAEVLEVRLVIDKNRAARIQTRLVPRTVPPSTNAPKGDQLTTMSPNPRVKRKRHSMTLRSERRQSFEHDVLSSSSPLSSPPSSSVIEAGRPSTRDPSLAGSASVHETEEPQLPETIHAPRPRAYTTPIQFPVTPASTGSRVWATRHPPSQDFLIWAEPHMAQTPSPIQEDEYMAFSPQDEDKENFFATRSDLSSSEDRAQQPHALDQSATSHRDAFGIPLAHQISDFVESNATNPQAESIIRPQRQVLHPILVPELDEPEETSALYDDSITQTQLRQIEEVEGNYQRGDQSRARNNLHAAFRYGVRVQGRTNFDTDIRRILEPQRREARRNALDEDEDEN
ncbi:hypothetical protein PENANT_c007G10482 [Penicillium antarcticum]|uniref:Uncharacterized protein n=1 Tax=Penicillium antarcticum TaxID=416450 RepID=A0A1V6QBI1_9EURO|nr:hypothetical protein PENANT_c007G10482 [Penicillium antarcticum]